MHQLYAATSTSLTLPENLYSESSNLAKRLSSGYNECTALDSWAEDRHGLFVFF